MKKCSKCGVEKDVSQFGAHARQKDGLQRACKQCQRDYFRAYRTANIDDMRAAEANWRENNRDLARANLKRFKDANPGCDREYSAAYRKRHPERRRESTARYRKLNAQRERIYRKLYASKNRDKLAARASMRRALKLMATPAWANKEAIEELYAFAARVSRDTGVPHHVDHIVPLVSDIVCGLHCDANLWVMPATDNLSKSNRYWPNMPD